MRSRSRTTETGRVGLSETAHCGAVRRSTSLSKRTSSPRERTTRRRSRTCRTAQRRDCSPRRKSRTEARTTRRRRVSRHTGLLPRPVLALDARGIRLETRKVPTRRSSSSSRSQFRRTTDSRRRWCAHPKTCGIPVVPKHLPQDAAPPCSLVQPYRTICVVVELDRDCRWAASNHRKPTPPLCTDERKLP